MGKQAEKGRSPQGERGLKSESIFHRPSGHSRSPQGERGLKYAGDVGRDVTDVVALRKESVD